MASARDLKTRELTSMLNSYKCMVNLEDLSTYMKNAEQIKETASIAVNTFVQTEPTEKQILRTQLKASTDNKFIIGKKYILQNKNKKLNKIYICKKFVYCINEEPLNIVIMKQISGPSTTRYTLGVDDCKKLHVKYMQGLEVFSMDLNWKLIND